MGCACAFSKSGDKDDDGTGAWRYKMSVPRNSERKNDPRPCHCDCLGKRSVSLASDFLVHLGGVDDAKVGRQDHPPCVRVRTFRYQSSQPTPQPQHPKRTRPPSGSSAQACPAPHVTAGRGQPCNLSSSRHALSPFPDDKEGKAPRNPSDIPSAAIQNALRHHLTPQRPWPVNVLCPNSARYRTLIASFQHRSTSPGQQHH